MLALSYHASVSPCRIFPISFYEAVDKDQQRDMVGSRAELGVGSGKLWRPTAFFQRMFLDLPDLCW